MFYIIFCKLFPTFITTKPCTWLIDKLGDTSFRCQVETLNKTRLSFYFSFLLLIFISNVVGNCNCVFNGEFIPIETCLN